MAENINKLLSFIGEANIADIIIEDEGGVDKLAMLGRQVVEDYDRDLSSMNEWADMVETGQELARLLLIPPQSGLPVLFFHRR